MTEQRDSYKSHSKYGGIKEAFNYFRALLMLKCVTAYDVHFWLFKYQHDYLKQELSLKKIGYMLCFYQSSEDGLELMASFK